MPVAHYRYVLGLIVHGDKIFLYFFSTSFTVHKWFAANGIEPLGSGGGPSLLALR